MPHDYGTAIFTVGMYLIDPFLMKMRSPLDPVSNYTLIVLVLTIDLFLALLGGLSGPPSSRPDGQPQDS